MKKPKSVKVSVIDRVEDEPGLYDIMDRLIARHHRHLSGCDIVLAWHEGWSEDPDGRVKLGCARKAADLDRELHRHDFVILLSKAGTSGFETEKMSALIDHELCHCEIAKHENGETKEDERGRPVLRIRKHDIEEFGEVVSRHGLYKRDLEQFAQIAMEKAEQPLLSK